MADETLFVALVGLRDCGLLVVARESWKIIVMGET